MLKHTAHQQQSSEAQHYHVLCNGVGWSFSGTGGVTFFKSAGPFNSILIVINNKLFAMALNKDTYQLLIFANCC